MLKLQIPKTQYWNSDEEVFEYVGPFTIEFNHCLKSISEWEAKFKKPFITNLEKYNKTDYELIDYIRIMTVTEGIPDIAYLALDENHINEINIYMEDAHSATTIKKQKEPNGKSEIMTSELIYYYMTALNIPFTCETWHLNRLLMLIDVCSIKNQPEKKMSPKEQRAYDHDLMAKRRAEAGKKG